MDETTYDEFDEDVREKILEYGHTVIGVFPTQDAPGVPFAYTVGRTLKQRPELLITGALPMQTMQGILNGAAEVDDDAPLEADTLRKDILGNDLLVKVVTVDPRAAEMFAAFREFGEENVTALQIIWPDKNGRFPFEGGYSLPPEAQTVFLGT